MNDWEGVRADNNATNCIGQCSIYRLKSQAVSFEFVPFLWAERCAMCSGRLTLSLKGKPSTSTLLCYYQYTGI